MALPKIAKVTHETTIPSTGKKIKFRPFLVKEEKVLILARESNDQNEMVKGIIDVIDACVMTKGFSTENLYTFSLVLGANLLGKMLKLLLLVLMMEKLESIIQFSWMK